MIKEFPRARYTLVRYIDIRYEYHQIATMDNGSSARSDELFNLGREILTKQTYTRNRFENKVMLIYFISSTRFGTIFFIMSSFI